MATLYALPSMTTWGYDTGAGASGWSNTSGGGQLGRAPNENDNVVFDANSGSSRTIANNGAACGGLICTGAAAMNLPAFSAYPYGTSIFDVSGMTSCGQISVATGTVTVRGANVPIAGFTGSAGVALGSNLTVTLDSQNPPDISLVSYTLTAPTFNNQSRSNASFDFGSGSLVLTDDAAVFYFQGSNCHIYPGSGTLKFTGAGSTTKLVTTYNSQTPLPNVWNATTGSGGLRMVCNSLYTGTGGQSVGLSCLQLKLSPGATQLFTAGYAPSIQSIVADGTALPITLKSSTPGTQIAIALTTASTVDHCDIKDLAMSVACKARSSYNSGNNANWTFVPSNSGLLQFF
jgi:hypothetical protein